MPAVLRVIILVQFEEMSSIRYTGPHTGPRGGGAERLDPLRRAVDLLQAGQTDVYARVMLWPAAGGEALFCRYLSARLE